MSPLASSQPRRSGLAPPRRERSRSESASGCCSRRRPTRTTRHRGLDAVVLMEVIEHIDPERLPALEASVFGAAGAEARSS